MAFRKIASCLIVAASLASAAQFPVRLKHFRKDVPGTLTVDETGVSFAGGPKAPALTWKYQDIQRLTISPTQVTVLTYKDNRFLLGADQSYEFTGEIPAADLTALLSPRLDQRFVAAIARPLQGVWLTIPAKHLRPITGTEGTLTFGENGIAYNSPADSRTWRREDIQNISSSGPFELTITTFEKAFHFQLKSPLQEAQYNKLWQSVALAILLPARDARSASRR